MTQLTRLIVQGISSGAIYGLVALGLDYRHKTTGALNFAQGDVVMLSAFLGWGLVVAAGLPFWLSFVAVLCIAATSARGPSEHAANPSARRFHRVRTTRVIPGSLHQGDEELTPALRLNRGVVASRYADLFTEPLGV